MRRRAGWWRGALVAAALLAAGQAALHLYHRRLLDLAGLERAAHARLERSRALAAAAADFDPEAVLRALGPSPKNLESFRLDEGLAEARISPPEVEAPDPAAALPAFEYEGSDPVSLLPGDAEHRVEGGVLEMEFARGDYLLTRGPLDVLGDTLAEIEIRIRLERGRGFSVGWSGRPLERWPDDEDRIDVLPLDVEADGRFHVYRIDARHALRLRPGKRIRTFFLVPSDAEQDRVGIDYVRFVGRRARFARSPAGRAYESRAGELRQVLYANAPRELAWDVRVPAEQPRLDLGMAVLGGALDLSAVIEDGGRHSEVLARRVEEADRWDDASIDLGRWAGRRVTLRLAAAGRSGDVAFWSNPRLAGAPAGRLNVLLVVEDTLRADHLSAYGHARPTSPAKDRLAREGVLFENAFSQDTKTRPSCPSFMTSLYPSATGVWSFEQRLGERFLTLAEILRSQGWETASFIQNTNAGPAAGLHQGFSHLWGPSEMGFRPDAIYGERVTGWIAAQRDRNWFAYLHVLDPHGVYDPPAPHDAFYREEGPGRTPVEPDPRLLDPAWVTRPTAEGRRLLYDGEIRNNDTHFGRFLERLRELGALRDTLVVFFSDHGEHLGEHGLWEHHPPGFVQVLHVPLLMAHPRLPKAVRIAEPVQLLDVVPTILELAEVDTTRLLLQGDSLLPLWRGDPGAAPGLALSEEATSYQRDRPERVRASLFYGGWHVLHTSHEDRRSIWIFDTRSDPGEERPLATRGLDLLLAPRLLGLLRAQKQANLAIWGALAADASEATPLDPEAQEQLRALGYIQ